MNHSIMLKRQNHARFDYCAGVFFLFSKDLIQLMSLSFLLPEEGEDHQATFRIQSRDAHKIY